MSAVERGRVLALVLSGLNAVLAEAKKTPPEPPGEATLLAGRGAVLDSLGLVSLVVDLEKRTEEEFGAVLTLAQEDSEPQAEGPFRSVGSLTDHLCRLLGQETA
ncbi:MAG: hypothetical protein FJ291_16770 [Planctomycetes bacterium]|nr:hypothetical protein [Planctomycetota bacterium]